ncbi:hypothetical protein diail_11678 [Diaporthe ilicicola]|nr:hypothetical protein diail_11678 [Diaporthe ilicicola]
MGQHEKAEAALTGEIESQDTQQALVTYHQQFGVGFRSSSPSQPLPADEVEAVVQQLPRPPKVHQKFAGANDSAQPSTSSSKPNANTSKIKADTNAQVKAKAKAGSRGRLAKENPATTGSCKGGKGKGRDSDADSTAAKRPGDVGTELDASNSRAASLSHRTTPTNSPRQATPSEVVGVFEPTFGSHSTGEHAQQQHDDNVIHLTPQSGTFAGTANLAQLSALDNHAAALVPSSSKQPKPRRRKMDPSQSPTQSNDGRSYEQYISRGDDLIPTDPMEKPEIASQQSTYTSNLDGEDRTLSEGDTGAVTFGNIDEYHDNFSVPDSLGTGNPETPAPHKNPFAGSKAHLLPASQMFGQTQVSSAYKIVSPTSSRPSPDNFQPQDSISPVLFISSPLKNLGTGLQPLHRAISSPQLPDSYGTSPQQYSDDHAELPGGVDSTPVHPARTFPRGRAEEYERLYSSQQRHGSSPQHALETESDGNASEDDAIRMHYRAALKKAKVEKQLRSIKYERPSPLEDAVVPSTNTRQGEILRTDSQNYLDQCEGRAGEDSQTTVEDSQDRVVDPSVGNFDSQEAVIDDSQEGVILRSAEPTAHISSNEAVVMATLPNTARSATRSPIGSTGRSPELPNRSNETGRDDGDPVPETSPTVLQPRPLGDMLPLSSGEGSRQESFSTLLRSSARENLSSQSRHPPGSTPPGEQSHSFAQARQPAAHRGKTGSNALDAVSPQATVEYFTSSVDQSTAKVTETLPVVESLSSEPAFSTRAKLRALRSQRHNTSPAVPGSSGSSLSALTTTPNISSETTPLTEDSPGGMTPSSAAEPHTSPTVAKAGRRRGAGVATKTKPAATTQKNLRTSTRRSLTSFGRDASVSTDELARSPTSSTPATFEQSAMLSRLGRTSWKEVPVTREPNLARGRNLFSGMVFAVSFLAKQPGEKDSIYNSRIGLSSKVAEQIRQGGGRLLPNGFEQLFEIATIRNAELSSSTPPPPPDEEIKLTADARSSGFTALIADGHSRKAKYMQALALGLPCLHERWITACSEKQKLVDWSDYLLCAGNSSFLGDAIRSRSLPIYDAASAKLSEIFDRRPQLLRGSRILLVLRKQDESKKMAYVFLARVLGASLSRVYTIDEARRQLKASEDAGHSYDWVYVEEKTAGKAALFAENATSPSAVPAASRKRKRKSAVDAE